MKLIINNIMRFLRLYKEKRLDTLMSLNQTYCSLMVPPSGIEPLIKPYHGSVIPLN